MFAPGMQMQGDIRQQTQPRAESTEAASPKATLIEINAAVIAEQNAAQNSKLEESAQDLMVAPSVYTIGPADVLQITVWDHPELAQALGSQPSAAPRAADAPQGIVVDEDGYIQFPYVGRVQVAGLTTSAIQARVAEALSHSFRNPQVTVRVESFRAKQIFVDGEVHSPGSLQINDVPMTLTDAIGRAGGFTASADKGRLQIIRGKRTYSVDLTTMLANGQNPAKIMLARSDVLRVPSRDESSVYVMGEVNKPVAAIPKTDGRLTLADALAQAGSFNVSTSDPQQLYVVRNAQSGHPDVFHIDAHSPVSMILASKFPLEPNDVVYVDGNELVRVNRVLSLLLPAIDAGLYAAVVTK
ncbi:EPS I polysaccharide export outer membrane protein EpsA [Paraburkholderia tropica]|uniref:polysaccharide biosynthesis/export family protein n=1 Tax=Paraburkholderia tropica TaxID=92647 RepID=UPI001CAE9479|nr:polysaccharide biosynthesis/export family protein [Paraburkholderia tropica]CAG9238480.1 EPS I polysaccharide export outer membrane protein EpsA [Paraburkholderia tropica]